MNALEELNKWHSVEGKGKSSVIDHPNSYGSGGWWSVQLNWKDMELYVDSLAETMKIRCTLVPLYPNDKNKYNKRRMYLAVRDDQEDSPHDIDKIGWPGPEELILKALEVMNDFDEIWSKNYVPIT